jgi:hypothetical protein
VTVLAPPSVRVAPEVVQVVPRGQLKLAAAVDGVADPRVSWSIREGTAGGTIDGGGVYAAPDRPGTYHVVATSVGFPTATAVSTIEVRAAANASRVHLIYLAATDDSEEVIRRRVAELGTAFAGIREFYADVIGAGLPRASFTPEPVRALRGHYSRAEWDDFGRRGFLYPDGRRSEDGGACSMYLGALYELADRGLARAAGLPAIGTPGAVYYVVNGGGTNGSCGAGGWLGASELNVLEELAAHCPSGRWDSFATRCAPAGVLAHELGHVFGLPHCSDRAGGCPGPSIMDLWWDYDVGATLVSDEVEQLVASPYFSAY